MKTYLVLIILFLSQDMFAAPLFKMSPSDLCLGFDCSAEAQSILSEFKASTQTPEKLPLAASGNCLFHVENEYLVANALLLMTLNNKPASSLTFAGAFFLDSISDIFSNYNYEQASLYLRQNTNETFLRMKKSKAALEAFKQSPQVGIKYWLRNGTDLRSILLIGAWQNKSTQTNSTQGMTRIFCRIKIH
jgi:hypothetical protein